jgi:hypothetical protein
MPGDSCPPMKSLVQRKAAKAAANDAPQPRKAQDNIF